MNFLFTSESVTEGHPDKVCDLISDSILDAYIALDPQSRVACETAVTEGQVVVMGEVTSKANIDVEAIIRETIRKIGYTKEEYGFNADTAKVTVMLHRQSPDIAQGVDSALEVRSEGGDDNGAGDQGMMFGYACRETEDFMPLPITLAHTLAKRLTEVRKNGTLKYLRPDGKTQVTVKYENGVPCGLSAIVVSAQHDPDVTLEDLQRDIYNEVIVPVVGREALKDVKIFINPTGRFVIGGPAGDTGLTGRKIIVDTYGGMGHHGGGAFSGKDPTKVDRTAAYAARHIAKNVVAAGLADKCEVEIAYAIGVANPVSLYIDTFGTGKVSPELISNAVSAVYDLRPSAIIRDFDLRRPIFKATAAYGHFGGSDAMRPWESLNKAQALKNYCENRNK